MNDNLLLLFDGCHKIYYAKRDDKAMIDEMLGYGYELHDGDFNKTLDELWKKACPLKFVEPANLNFDQPHVPQSDISQIKGFKTKLHNYFKESK